MNIAILTTWSSKCGIAQYASNLCHEFELMGHNLLVLNNAIEASTSTITGKGAWVGTKVFGVNWWGEDASFAYEKAWDMMNAFEKYNGSIDVLHVQYQGSLYEPEGFNSFINGVSEKKVITFHDSSKHPRHNFDKFISIAHNQNINADNYLPFPTIERTPVVFSFGMGRNDYAFIEKACKEIGVDFEGHDARKDGWLSEDILFEKMNNADAIVLWYNDVPIYGQSAALRTAISSMRPVIVNDIPWFQDAPDFVIKVAPKDHSKEFTAKAALQATLWDVLHIKYIRQHSFKRLAEKHMEIYNGQ
jgi:hypothetical protein